MWGVSQQRYLNLLRRLFFDYLDDHLELTENRREYIEEEMNEEAQKVHDFVVEKKAVNGKMEA